MDDQTDKQSSETQEPVGTMQLDVVSAEKQIFSGQVKMVIVTGKDGEIGVMPGHTQLLAELKPGHVRYVKLNGEEEYMYISGGFVEVQPQIVTILSDTVLRAAEIDQERATEAKERAEKELAKKGQEIDDYTAALIELAKAIAQLRVLRKARGMKK